MTDQPQYPSYPGPEQPGGGAPPPPSGYGQPPPPRGYNPPPGYGQAPPSYGAESYPTGPATPYAGWWPRVGAALLDGIIAMAVIAAPLIAGLVIAFKDAEVDPVTSEISGGVEPLGILLLVLTGVMYFAFDIWNRGVRLGARGQSLGKQIVGIRIVRAADGQLLGAGSGFVRWLMAFVLGLVSCVALIDVLWPLWDDKNQTLHDKIVGSVPLKV